MPDELAVHIHTITIFGIPIRVDRTLVDEDEIWLEGPDGTAVLVWPPPADSRVTFTEPTR